MTFTYEDFITDINVAVTFEENLNLATFEDNIIAIWELREILKSRDVKTRIVSYLNLLEGQTIESGRIVNKSLPSEDSIPSIGTPGGSLSMPNYSAPTYILFALVNEEDKLLTGKEINYKEIPHHWFLEKESDLDGSPWRYVYSKDQPYIVDMVDNEIKQIDE